MHRVSGKSHTWTAGMGHTKLLEFAGYIMNEQLINPLLADLGLYFLEVLSAKATSRLSANLFSHSM